MIKRIIIFTLALSLALSVPAWAGFSGGSSAARGGGSFSGGSKGFSSGGSKGSSSGGSKFSNGASKPPSPTRSAPSSGSRPTPAPTRAVPLSPPRISVPSRPGLPARSPVPVGRSYARDGFAVRSGRYRMNGRSYYVRDPYGPRYYGSPVFSNGGSDVWFYLWAFSYFDNDRSNNAPPPSDDNNVADELPSVVGLLGEEARIVGVR